MPLLRHMTWPCVALTLTALTMTSCGGEEAGATGPQSLADLFDPAAQAARQVDVQAAVQTCMKDQGFEYTPIDVSSMQTVFRVGPGGSEDLTDEERRTKGYGITTGMAQPMVVEASNADPNAGYVESLSEADREAYNKALFGSSVQGGDTGGFVVSVSGTADGAGPATNLSGADGCFAEAERTVPQVGPDMSKLGPQIQDMEKRIAADPELIKSNEAWARCMKESGFDQFESPDDIFQWLFGKLGGLSGATPPPDGGEVGGSGGISISIGIPGAGLDEAELSELQATEIAIAVADGKCADTTGRSDVAERVRAEQEARFFDEHPELGG